MIRPHIALPILLALSTVLPVQGRAATGADAVSAAGGWIRETPPGRTVAAGYVTLTNAGDTPVAVVGAASSAARVELHSMRMEEGMMRMRPLPRLEIPAGSSAALAPRGDHMMLFDVDATTAGAIIELELLFEDGSTLPLALPVRRDAPAGD